MKELWKNIKGYEGLYQISNLGNVKSLSRKVQFTNSHGTAVRITKTKILKPGKQGLYLGVVLRKDGIGKSYYIHRLLAEHFIPNPNNLPEVNHKDENKFNNDLNNLEWCTHQYNSSYGTISEKHSKANKGRKHSEDFRKRDSEIKKEWWKKKKLQQNNV